MKHKEEKIWYTCNWCGKECRPFMHFVYQGISIDINVNNDKDICHSCFIKQLEEFLNRQKADKTGVS